MNSEGLFPTLSRQGLTEAVEQAIRRAILEGRLAAGDRLVESRISEELGVSRAPVREALARLAQRGLVISLANRGTFVVRVGPEDVRELFELRSVLEGYAASRAARRPAHELAYLEQLAEAAREAARVDNVEAAAERDLEFSAQLVELAGSRRLVQVWQGVADQLRLALPGLARAGTGPAPVEGLGRLLDALRRHDAKAAAEAVADHLARWQPLWLRAVSGRD